MKKIFLALLLVYGSTQTMAQNDYKKLPSLGIHFFFNDFQTASEIRSNGLSEVLKANQFYKIKRMTPGLAISYIEGLGNHIDFAGTISGSFGNFPVPNLVTNTNRERFLLEGVATANLKLLTDKYTINPFITLGVGASQYAGFWNAIIPAGLGLQFKVSRDAFLLLNSQYRIPITENASYHLYHSIGFAGNIRDRKVVEFVPPVIIPIVKDRDGDGVIDEEDKCPDVAGLASLQGCPDKDADGIADSDDKCPDVAGLVKYQGCPIPDTDKDGVNDEMDKCVTVAGVARYQGCPIPDTDGDGVNDEEDKCPSRPGPATNQGCPEIAKEVIEKINFAAKNVFYSTGSFKLLSKSNAALDEVAKLLTTDPNLMLDIDGHTDAQGSDVSNQTLSENRANSVRDYLIKKGIDGSRLKATGFGETKPIADNTTAAGRAKNRRTEMTVRNF